jgi:hypothetical protein
MEALINILWALALLFVLISIVISVGFGWQYALKEKGDRYAFIPLMFLFSGLGLWAVGVLIIAFQSWVE